MNKNERLAHLEAASTQSINDIVQLQKQLDNILDHLDNTYVCNFVHTHRLLHRSEQELIKCWCGEYHDDYISCHAPKRILGTTTAQCGLGAGHKGPHRTVWMDIRLEWD